MSKYINNNTKSLFDYIVTVRDRWPEHNATIITSRGLPTSISEGTYMSVYQSLAVSMCDDITSLIHFERLPCNRTGPIVYEGTIGEANTQLFLLVFTPKPTRVI